MPAMQDGMVDLLKHILRSQYGAALCMFDNCVAACREEHWEGRIANGSFRQIAYHTLFFTDLYLSPGREAFELRELHQRGGDERGPTLCPGLEKTETLAYAKVCRRKARDAIGAETEASLRGPCGFRGRRGMSRAELHVYNIRHVQHHAGAMAAFLRRVDPNLKDDLLRQLKWVGRG